MADTVGAGDTEGLVFVGVADGPEDKEGSREAVGVVDGAGESVGPALVGATVG